MKMVSILSGRACKGDRERGGKIAGAGEGDGTRAPITGPLPGPPLGVALVQFPVSSKPCGPLQEGGESERPHRSIFRALHSPTCIVATCHPRDSLHKFHPLVASGKGSPLHLHFDDALGFQAWVWKSTVGVVG